MPEFFINANSFAAPFVSDSSAGYVEAVSAHAALEQYAEDYRHPAGLYVARAYRSADDFHKGKPAAAEWQSNQLRAKEQATAGMDAYSYYGKGQGEFEINGESVKVEDPRAGSVV